MRQARGTSNACWGAGGSERTAVTCWSSLRWQRDEEPELWEREPEQEEAQGAGEETSAGEGARYSAGAGESNAKREQGR